MEKGGDDGTEQRYPFNYYTYKSPLTLSEVSPTAHTFRLNDEFIPGQSTGTATNAVVQPVKNIVMPPTTQPSSASGCVQSDFDGFTPGSIALIQRGTCNFGVKIQNAQNAHAAGVIIFNEGNTDPDRTAVFGGSIQDANDVPFVANIPVAFTSFAIGKDLYDDYYTNHSPAVMNFTIDAIVQENADDWNVIADSKGGDKNHVLVVDAHLDAIYGAGMLDNASGSATILDIPQKMKNVNPTNKLRFIWFGGEELGLLGSDYYVKHLSSTDLSHIGYDLDADVTATPNYTLGVLDPAGPDLFGGPQQTFPNRVYDASTIARDQAVGYLSSQGKNHEFFSPVGTDAFNFNLVGIPASGVLTGQDCCKTQQEVDLFGGYLGNYEGNVPSFDGGCVDNPFRWCDNLSNNDPTVLTFMSKAFADMTARMAYDKSVVWAGEDVHKPKGTPASAGPRGSAAR